MKTRKICEMTAAEYRQVVRLVRANKAVLSAIDGAPCTMQTIEPITAQLMLTAAAVLGFRCLTQQEYNTLRVIS